MACSPGSVGVEKNEHYAPVVIPPAGPPSPDPEFLSQSSKPRYYFFPLGPEPLQLAQSILRLPKAVSSTALPDAKMYHMACHLTRVLDWCRHGPLKQWVQVERLLAGVQLDALPLVSEESASKDFRPPHCG